MASETRPWWVELFESGDYMRYWVAHRAADPLDRLGPERTERQADFVLEALGLAPGATLLDLCCGHGRHSIALARRGLRVLGIDLARYHLRLARAAARAAGADVQWLRADMRRIPKRLDGSFDAVINMFTAFGYFDDDAEDQRVLDGIARALKPGGRFLIDFINREAVFRRFRERDWEEVEGTLLLHDRCFDFVTGRNRETVTIVAADNVRRTMMTSVRMYTLAELVAMLQRAGMRFVRAWGDFDGSEVMLDSRRLIVLAQK